MIQKDSIGQNVTIGDKIAFMRYKTMHKGHIVRFTAQGYPSVSHNIHSVHGYFCVRGDYAKIFDQKIVV